MRVQGLDIRNRSCLSRLQERRKEKSVLNCRKVLHHHLFQNKAALRTFRVTFQLQHPCSQTGWRVLARVRRKCVAWETSLSKSHRPLKSRKTVCYVDRFSNFPKLLVGTFDWSFSKSRWPNYSARSRVRTLWNSVVEGSRGAVASS